MFFSQSGFLVGLTTSLLLFFALELPVSECLAANNRKKGLPLRKRPLKDTLVIEKDLQQRGFRFVIGSDESGVGCIAGPVVAASCCVVPDLTSATSPPPEVLIEGVDDSKALTRASRERIYAEILSKPETFVWSVATQSNEQIDDASLETATKNCFGQSIENVMKQLQNRFELDENEDPNVFYSIVDGHRSPAKLSITSRPWKGGDEVVYSVALSSIIARCHHEKIMSDLASLHPLYNFETHGGYPTRDHVQALHQHGPSSVHRRSCKPVKGR